VDNTRLKDAKWVIQCAVYKKNRLIYECFLDNSGKITEDVDRAVRFNNREDAGKVFRKTEESLLIHVRQQSKLSGCLDPKAYLDGWSVMVVSRPCNFD
jgi:hypothetical protein